jgi:hypothetical protein
MSRIVPGVAIGLVLAAVGVVDSGSASSPSGIRGRVTSSPTCPVEQIPPDPACAPRGFAARLTIRRVSDNAVAARVATKADGSYSVRLKAGRYSVSARPASGRSPPTCPRPVRTTVRTGRYTRVAIDCDSGIR